VVAGAGPGPISWLGRALLYFVAGFGVGFLLLTEFALRTFAAVQVAIVLLAALGLFGGLRARSNLSVWSLFIVGALSFPLLVDANLASLPLCREAPSIGCIARDYRGVFAVEVVGFIAAAAGTLLHLLRGSRTQPRA